MGKMNVVQLVGDAVFRNSSKQCLISKVTSSHWSILLICNILGWGHYTTVQHFPSMLKSWYSILTLGKQKEIKSQVSTSFPSRLKISASYAIAQYYITT